MANIYECSIKPRQYFTHPAQVYIANKIIFVYFLVVQLYQPLVFKQSNICTPIGSLNY